MYRGRGWAEKKRHPRSIIKTQDYKAGPVTLVYSEDF